MYFFHTFSITFVQVLSTYNASYLNYADNMKPVYLKEMLQEYILIKAKILL